MIVEEFLRKHIHLILEKTKDDDTSSKEDSPEEKPSVSGPTTQRLTGGRYSKKLEKARSLADTDPKALMDKLSIKRLTGDPPGAVFEMLVSAVDNTTEMSDVYASPESVDDGYGRKGAYLKIKGDSPIRDAALFLRLTSRGARKAGFIGFNEKIFVEKYEGGILVYTGDEPYTWNAKPIKKKQK